MRFRLSLYSIERCSRSPRGSSQHVDAVNAPTVARDHPHNGSGGDNRSISEPNEVSIRVHGATQEGPVSPFVVQFGSRFLWHEPKYSLAEFTHTMLHILPMKVPIGRPSSFVDLASVEVEGCMFDKPPNDGMRARKWLRDLSS